MKQLPAVLLTLLWSAVLLSAQAPGTLDASFGDGGFTQTDYAGISNTARMLLPLPDGKLIVLGNCGNNLTLTHVAALRYHTDGTRDNGFGTAGIFVEAGFGSTPSSVDYCELWSGALQPDGKILMAGTARVNSTLRHFLIRLTANGQRDAAFGSNGIVLVSPINYFEPRGIPVGIALQNDGKILMISGIMQDGKFTLLRFNTNGTPDSGFGTGGMLHLTSSVPGIVSPAGIAVAIQPDEKILVKTLSTRPSPMVSQMHLFRLLPDGSPDTSFSDDGEALLNGSLAFGDFANQIFLQPDGKILVGRSASSLTRLLPNGQLDNSFGMNGNSGSGLNFSNFTLQQDGKIVGAGSLSNRAMLVRLNANGLGDNTINSTGISGVMELLESPSNFTDAIQQPDGKIVACGRLNGDFLLARYHSQTISAAHAPLEALTGLRVGSNPTRGQAELYFPLSEPLVLSVTVVSATGQLVQTAKTATGYPAGAHRLPVDLSHLPAGPYFLVLSGAGGQQSVLVNKVN